MGAMANRWATMGTRFLAGVLLLGKSPMKAKPSRLRPGSAPKP